MTAPRASFKSFQESTREDWAIINTQLAETQRMAVDHILEQLRYLERDHGGFPVSRSSIRCRQRHAPSAMAGMRSI